MRCLELAQPEVNASESLALLKKIFCFSMKVKQSLSYKIRDYLVVSIAYNLKMRGILTAGDLESH